MPRPRFERAAPIKRDALLDAAAAEFAAHGYENASINRILLAAGFSKGSFYYYFDDKADLAAAVVEHEALRLISVVRTLGAPATPVAFWRAVDQLVAESQALSEQRPRAMDALTRLGTAAAHDPALLARMTNASLREVWATTTAFWAHGQAVGAVRDDLPVDKLVAVVQAIKLSLTSLLLPADRAPSREELATFMRVYMDMLRRISERRPGGDDAAPVSKGRRRS